MIKGFSICLRVHVGEGCTIKAKPKSEICYLLLSFPDHHDGLSTPTGILIIYKFNQPENNIQSCPETELNTIQGFINVNMGH